MSTEDYSDVLRTSRYKLYGVLGKGSWGTVYAAKDTILGTKVAIKVLTPTEESKEKLRKRQITPFEAVAREGGFVSAAHIVPREFGMDENNVPFIVMPQYKEFFDQRIGDRGRRAFLRDKSLEERTVATYLTDIAKGIEEMHRTRRRAHADIKPDNIAVEDGKLLLNDLGNATLTTLDWAERQSPRDNMGAWYTRAPELFLDDSHPGRSSDVWSFGALAYRLITGKYPLEDELENARNPQEYIASLGKEGLDAVLQRKVRAQIKDRRMRKLISKSLLADPNRRLSSEDLLDRVEDATDGSVWRDVARISKRLAVGVGTVAALTGGAYVLMTAPERPKAEPPKVSGLLYLEDANGKTFDIEDLNDLGAPMEGAFIGDVDRVAKRYIDKPSIAYLVSCKSKAMLEGGIWTERLTPNEIELFEAHALPKEKEDVKNNKVPDAYVVSAVALEATMNLIRDARGRVDLEDLLVQSRLGRNWVPQIALAATGGNFRDYQEMLPEKEHEFIKRWLAYIHDGLARK